MSASYDVRPERTKRATGSIASDFSDQFYSRHPLHAESDKATASVDTSDVHDAIARTRQWLLDRQQDDGSWCAELEGDTILESETILMLAFLRREHTTIARRAAAYLVGKQLPGGGWAKFPGGELDISGSVKAYFALKLTGHDPEADFMVRAREAIRAHGGADAVNSFTRFYLALLGQIAYEHCPAVPPEMVLLPKWFPVNLYAISAWSRTIVVPLSIVAALEPVRPDRAGARHPRTVLSRAGALAAAPLSGAARRNWLVELGPFLPRYQSSAQVRPAERLDAVAEEGGRGRAAMDSGPIS